MKIVSGGQTGADRAALDVAIELGIPYGGAIPRGRLAEDGIIDPKKYLQLTELKRGKYITRTRKNVADSDATLAFTDGRLTGGTARTIEFAEKLGKPYLHINLRKVAPDQAESQIRDWLRKIKPEILNVAGPRESTSPGIYVKVHGVLRGLLEDVELFY